jgi:hypothetical protein
MPTQAQSYKLVAITTIISLSQLEAANSLATGAGFTSLVGWLSTTHSRTITLTRTPTWTITPQPTFAGCRVIKNNKGSRYISSAVPPYITDVLKISQTTHTIVDLRKSAQV